MLRRTILQLPLVPAVLGSAPRQTGGAESNSGVSVWLQSSLKRVFPNSPPMQISTLQLLSARNQHLSFQVCVRNETQQNLQVFCNVAQVADLQTQVRRVGYVPLPHHTTNVPASDLDGLGCVPGLVPDPLFPEQHMAVGPWETQAFWITVRVPSGAAAANKRLTITLSAQAGKSKSSVALPPLTADIDVRPLTLKARKNFPVSHWWHADAIYERYKIEPFGEAWWLLVEKHMQNMAAHGSNTMIVPLFHQRTEIVPQPCQLLDVKMPSPARYEFDWTPIERFVRLGKKNGIEYFEFPHLWLYWEVKYPTHVYQRQGDKWTLLWPADSPATTGPYRVFLEQFLPQLHGFLLREDLLDRSFFHISDEPGGEVIENYRRAHALLKELAPWTDGKVLDALSDVQYGKQGLVDIPVPLLPSAEKYREAGIPHWVYFCTGPRGKFLNRLFDTPLPKTRMAGFLFYRLGAKGFLHWGYDYWFKMNTQDVAEVFQEGAGYDWPGIPYGDPFVVYPGPDGPLDSIRWEVFAEALQDYALLQTLNVSPDSPLLEEIKTYEYFPKTETWIEAVRAKLLKS